MTSPRHHSSASFYQSDIQLNGILGILGTAGTLRTVWSVQEKGILEYWNGREGIYKRERIGKKQMKLDMDTEKERECVRERERALSTYQFLSYRVLCQPAN